MSQQALNQRFQSKHPVPDLVREALEKNNIFTAAEWAEKALVSEVTIRVLLRGSVALTELQTLLKVAHIIDIPVDILATLCVNSSPEDVVSFIKKRLNEKQVSVRSFRQSVSKRWVESPSFEQIKTYYRIYTVCLQLPLSVVAGLLLPNFSCRGVLTKDSGTGTLNSSNFHKSFDDVNLSLDKPFGKAA